MPTTSLNLTLNQNCTGHKRVRHIRHKSGKLVLIQAMTAVTESQTLNTPYRLATRKNVTERLRISSM